MGWLKIYVSELEIIGAAILIILLEILSTSVAFEVGQLTLKTTNVVDSDWFKCSKFRFASLYILLKIRITNANFLS